MTQRSLKWQEKGRDIIEEKNRYREKRKVRLSGNQQIIEMEERKNTQSVNEKYIEKEKLIDCGLEERKFQSIFRGETKSRERRGQKQDRMSKVGWVHKGLPFPKRLEGQNSLPVHGTRWQFSFTL